MVNRIYATKKELSRRENFPLSYLDTLESRLVIAFRPLDRLPRNSVRREIQESRSLSIRRKARKVYLEILDEDPNIFLPFILQVSEQACRTFDVSLFLHQHKKEPRINLNTEAKDTLDDIAARNGILQARGYRTLVTFLFTQPKPSTAADGNQHWAYSAASLQTTQKLLSDQLFKEIQNSTALLQKQGIHTTECVRMKFPKEDFQDVILMLDVGLNYNVIGELFPRISGKLKSILQENPSSEVDAGTDYLDNAHFTLSGASLAGVTSNFCPSICQAIEKSQLRRWEKTNLLYDTTDCVTMRVYRNQPSHGTVHLRLSFIESFEIMNTLFSPDIQLSH